MFPVSTHKGQAISTFPDVCKVPILGVPTPIPYSNISMTSGRKTATKTATKSTPTYKVTSGDEAGSLRTQLTRLHQKLMAMPASDATQWHKTLDEYVMTTAQVYNSLSTRR